MRHLGNIDTTSPRFGDTPKETKEEGFTHEQRLALIKQEEAAGYLGRMAVDSSAKLAQWNAHIDRLHLIYKPFPVVRRIGTGSAATWAGVIVADTFMTYPQRANRPRGMTSGANDESLYGLCDEYAPADA